MGEGLFLRVSFFPITERKRQLDVTRAWGLLRGMEGFLEGEWKGPSAQDPYVIDLCANNFEAAKRFVDLLNEDGYQKNSHYRLFGIFRKRLTRESNSADSGQNDRNGA